MGGNGRGRGTHSGPLRADVRWEIFSSNSPVGMPGITQTDPGSLGPGPPPIFGSPGIGQWSRFQGFFFLPGMELGGAFSVLI